MPVKKYKRKMVRKTKRITKYKNKNSYQTLGKTLGGFADTSVARLRYVDHVVLDSAVNTIVHHNFRAASVYDPDQTGGGHQPMNYDIWEQNYNYYVVLSSRIRIKMLSIAVTDLIPGYFGILLSSDVDQVDSFSSILSLLESRGITYKSYGSFVESVTPKGMHLTKNYSAKKFNHYKDIEDVSDLVAATGANPLQNPYFIVWTSSINGNNPGAVTFQVQIDYMVKFQGFKQQGIAS